MTWSGTPPGWVTRRTARRPGIGTGDPQPDEQLGLRRARAATLLMLALPGSAYLYQGEELGLPEHTEMPDEFRQDPNWVRKNYTERGRDGARVPLPWVSTAMAFGFGGGESTWLPQPTGYGRYARDLQEVEPTSTLGMYRSALALRREFDLGRGELEWTSEPGAAVLAFAGVRFRSPAISARTRSSCPPARSCCSRAARRSRPAFRPTAACGGALSGNGRRSALLRRRRKHRG